MRGVSSFKRSSFCSSARALRGWTKVRKGVPTSSGLWASPSPVPRERRWRPSRRDRAGGPSLAGTRPPSRGAPGAAFPSSPPASAPRRHLLAERPSPLPPPPPLWEPGAGVPAQVADLGARLSPHCPQARRSRGHPPLSCPRPTGIRVAPASGGEGRVSEARGLPVGPTASGLPRTVGRAQQLRLSRH